MQIEKPVKENAEDIIYNALLSTIKMAKTKKILEDFGDYQYVVGLDEVGRGAGAGPVVTAAVIMPKGFKSELIRDSKQLTEKQRKDISENINELLFI
jgi:ribonuclease HII